MTNYPNEGPDKRIGVFGLLGWLQNMFSRKDPSPEHTQGLFLVLIRPFALVFNLPWFGGKVKHFRMGGRMDNWGLIRPTIALKTMNAPLPHVRWRKDEF